MSIKELWRKIRGFCWDRYPVVKPRWITQYTWIDRRELLAYSMMEILVRFLEEECSPGHVEWYGEYGHKIEVNGKKVFVLDEMWAIYNWWLDQYLPFENNELDIQKYIWAEIDELGHDFVFVEIPDRLFDGKPLYEMKDNLEGEDLIRYRELMNRANKLDEIMYHKLQEILHRLINIRGYMWT